MKSVLIVDDDKNLLYSLERLLSKSYDVSVAENSKEAINLIDNQSFNIIFLDLRIGVESGQDILKYIRKNNYKVPIIMLSAYGANSTVIESMAFGADDFITKPVLADALIKCIEEHTKSYGLQCNISDILIDDNPIESDEFVGVSEAIKNLLKTTGTISQQDYPILITGETGVGKDLLAKLIHKHSKRAHKPYVSINCPAIPENLLESELFGHTKGAFTGAYASKEGKFEVARGGTILLDEIGDMPIGLQAKILRVLQEGIFERLGDNKLIHSDVRIISGTNQNLITKIENGLFRQDLYYRLNVIDIEIPPLHKRPDDIIPLAIYFVKLYAKLQNKVFNCIRKDACDILINNYWHGNVRELQNVIKKVVTLSNSECLTSGDFEFIKNDKCLQNKIDDLSLPNAIEKLEQSFIANALKKCDGRLNDAAKLLSISRVTLNEKRKKYNLM